MSTTDLLEQARARRWYHVLEFDGYTTTGIFDMRRYVPLYGLPDDLAGKRCLDVGTHDGFVALHMERQGASEVVAIDLPDLTARRGIRCLLKVGGFDVEEVSRYSLLRFGGAWALKQVALPSMNLRDRASMTMNSALARDPRRGHLHRAYRCVRRF